MKHYIILAALLLPVTLTAQRSGSKQAGTIEGDVFLVMRSGDVKPAAGRDVFLVHSPSDVEVGIAKACLGLQQNLDRTDEHLRALADSIGLAGYHVAGYPMQEFLLRDSVSVASNRAGLATSTAGEIGRAVHVATVAQSATGMHAHFVFPRVAPGRYGLFSFVPIGDHLYFWWSTVTVKAGGHTRADLDNAASDRFDGLCPGMAQIDH